MGKQVLGIIGSHRKTGNSEIVVKSAAEQMGSEWTLSLIRLPHLKIDPCKGCYACLIPGRECNIKDNSQWVFDRILEADAVIIGAPNYVLGPVGIMKMLADRGIQATDNLETLQKKKAAVALTMGREEYRGYADAALASQVNALGLEVVSLESFIGTFPGEVAMSGDYTAKIKRMADSIAVSTNEKLSYENRCPRCYSDIFRICDNDLECALCKSRAKFDQGALSFYYFDPEFTPEGRLEHNTWLVNKKNEYEIVKDKCREIQEQYRGGNWLLPS